MEYLSYSAQQTQYIAAQIAPNYLQGGVIAFSGKLGAGKTTFTQGFAKGLKVSQKITSPTFVLIKEYFIPDNPSGKLYHIDLYRLNQITEIANLGISEILANPANIVLIEWAEKLGQSFPKKATKIDIQLLDKTSRKITIT